MFADHPHGRGENYADEALRSFGNGPSPRAWGKPKLCIIDVLPVRTIPTGVGKTARRTLAGLQITDHPHGRGENQGRAGKGNRKSGPSPRAWGKRLIILRRLASWRTIPTGVGKTVDRDKLANWLTDHPHGRGEN